MNQLSKCCNAEIEWIGGGSLSLSEDDDLEPRCSACRLWHPEVVTSPTSADVEEFVNDITVAHGIWHTDFERDLVKGITRLIQQAELRGEIKQVQKKLDSGIYDTSDMEELDRLQAQLTDSKEAQ